MIDSAFPKSIQPNQQIFSLKYTNAFSEHMGGISKKKKINRGTYFPDMFEYSSYFIFLILGKPISGKFIILFLILIFV